MVVVSRSIGSMYPSLATKMRCIATVNSWKVRWPSPSMSDSFLERSKKNLYFSTFMTVCFIPTDYSSLVSRLCSSLTSFPCGLGTRLDCTTLWHK